MTKNDLIKEVNMNYASFSLAWQEILSQTINKLGSNVTIYQESYLGVASLQAWRDIFNDDMRGEALGFYDEAQNDLLASHVSAQFGSWRLALKSLRSALENVLQCIYYKDHPIEYLMWEEGRHRMSFSDLLSYIESHPSIRRSGKGIIEIAKIRNELGVLSKAVHGSSIGFRMTESSSFPRIFSDDLISLRKWRDREKGVLSCINGLMLAIYMERLVGTQFLQQRIIISSSLKDSQIDAALSFGVNLRFK